MVFNIQQVKNSSYYVVQIENEKGDLIDLTKRFKTFSDANNWLKQLNNNHIILTDIPF